jgi:hypothetical protein
LKDKIDKLEKENQALKGRLDSATPARHGGQSRQLDDPATPEAEDNGEDGSNQPHELFLPGDNRSQSLVDDSLEIEEPSFADDRQGKHTSANTASQAIASSSRIHPTARTFSYNMDDSVSTVAKKRKPQRSKYFSANESEDDIDPDGDDADEVGNDSLIIIPASSPQRPSPTKRSRTNPFSTTREAHAAKTKLVPKKKTEVIDLASSSPRSPFKPASTNIPERSGGPSRQNGNQKNTLSDYITGMTDKSGRPKKGLASGARVRHRA